MSGHLSPPHTARKPRRYYIATDGAVIIWRETITPLRSATIRPAWSQWRASRASGANSYPAIQITEAQYGAVMRAWSRAGSGSPWIDNDKLPRQLAALLKVPAPRLSAPGWDEIEAGLETVR
jgi:hypothetical protein